MKLIIAGSRTITEEDFTRAIGAFQFRENIKMVISGRARGADQFGENWARKEKIPIQAFPANWKEYGKRAGYLRNKEMAKAADAALVIWDGLSKGSKHMIDLALEEKLNVCIYRTDLGTTAYYMNRKVEEEALLQSERNTKGNLELSLKESEILSLLVQNNIEVLDRLQSTVSPDLLEIKDRLDNLHDKLLNLYLSDLRGVSS